MRRSNVGGMEEGLSHISGTLVPSLQENLQVLRNMFGVNMDFAIRPIDLAGHDGAICFFTTLVDLNRLQEHVIAPIQQGTVSFPEDPTPRHLFKRFRELAAINDAVSHQDWQHIVSELLKGKALLLVDGQTEGLLIDTGKVEKRSVGAPETEQAVIGPRESFVEILDTNVTLIRQRLRDPRLRVEQTITTRRTRQTVAMLYLQDVANPDVVNEVRDRLSLIETDALQGQVHLQELLEKNSYSLFPTIRPTERPDVVSSYLLEGNVVLMLDGAAHALVFPITFFQLLDTVDDYYNSWQYATLIRFVRIIALMLSTITPGLYLSLVAYNPELIPTRLVISMDAARAKVALPIVIEVFVMEVMIEVLREAGVKLPKPVGQAVSIIGGLVIGEAAVNANLVSPVTVVIVALTAISSFTAPVYLLGVTYRILRFFVLLCSGILGLYGFLLSLFVIHAHVSKLVSFGVPYLAPLSPLRLQDWRDTVIRVPFRKLVTRPTFNQPLQPDKAKPLPLLLRKSRKK